MASFVPVIGMNRSSSTGRAQRDQQPARSIRAKALPCWLFRLR